MDLWQLCHKTKGEVRKPAKFWENFICLCHHCGGPEGQSAKLPLSAKMRNATPATTESRIEIHALRCTPVSTILIIWIIFVCTILSLVLLLRCLLLSSSQNQPNIPSSSPHRHPIIETILVTSPGWGRPRFRFRRPAFRELPSSSLLHSHLTYKRSGYP